ncbi:MAG: hypothetical protein R2882_12795 [Gemmatimonadales bacterium]
MHQVADLPAQTLAQPEARDFLVSWTMDVVSSELLARSLEILPGRR